MAITQLNDANRPWTAYIQTAGFRTPDDGMFPFNYWIAYSFEYDDLSSDEINIDVPPGAIVLQVLFQISEVFTDTTAIIVGDDTDPNGWIADAWGTGAIGVYTDYTAAYAAVGKRYNAGDCIDVAFTTTPTAGSGKVFIKILSYTEVLTGT